MRFLVDTQLPKLLSRRLKEAGHAAEHVLDLNLGQSPDNDLRRYASANDAVIVSKDEDFAQWVISGRSGPKVVWLRVGNSINAVPEPGTWAAAALLAGAAAFMRWRKRKQVS